MPSQNQAKNEFVIGVRVVGGPQLENLKKQIAAIGGKAAGINKLFSAGGAQALEKNLGQINTTLAAFNKASGESAAQHKKAETVKQQASQASMDKFRSHASAFTTYNQKIISSARLNKNEITDMFRRVALWSAGVGVLFGTISKIKYVFGAVKDLEVQMAELKKVMSDDTPFKLVQKSLFGVSEQMSASARKSFEVATIWAQQGKNQQEVASLTRASLIGVNSANLTAIESVEFLTSATKSFNVEAEKSENVIDAIMAVQADYAVTAQDLAIGLTKAGATTAQLNGNMYELFGMMTAVGEVTRETGSQIGNSFKTMVARMQQPKVMEFLKKFNIEMEKIEDNAVKRLSPFEIFEQIAKKRVTGELTKEQVLDISIAVGGQRRFKDAVILIEKFETAEAARIKSLYAYGDAAKASTIAQETLEKKLERLDVAFVKLGQVMADEGLTKGLKFVVETITSLTDVVSSFAGDKSGIGPGLMRSLPLFLLGGFGRGIGGRVSQNMRGSALRDVDYLASVSGTGLEGSAYKTMYTYFGKTNKLSENFLKEWETQTTQMNAIAKRSGTEFSSTHRYLAFQNALMSANGAEILKGSKVMKGVIGRMARSFLVNAVPLGFGMREGGVSQGGLLRTTLAGKAGSLLKGLVKGGLILGTIELAIQGVTALLDKFQSQFKDLTTTIDPTSIASKSFEELAVKLKSVKEEAEKSGKSIEAYAESLSFYQKFELLRPIAEAIGLEIFKGMKSPEGVNNLEEARRKLIDLGISKEFLKTQRAAEELIVTLAKFYKFEVAGNVEEARVIVNKGLAKFYEELMEDIASSIIEAKPGAKLKGKFSFTKGQGEYVRTLDEFKAAGKIGEVLFELIEAYKDSITEINKTGVANLQENLGLNVGAQTAQEFNALFDIAKRAKLAGADIKDPEKVLGDYIKKELELSLDEAYKGFKGVPRTTSSIIEKQAEQASSTMMRIANDEIQKFLSGMLTEGQLNIITGITHPLKPVNEYIRTSAMKMVGALIDAEDKIYIQTSKFVNDMESIQIKDNLSGILGLPSTPAMDRLKATRNWMENAAIIASDLRMQERNLSNMHERASRIIAENFPEAAGALAKRERGEITGEEYIQDIDDIEDENDKIKKDAKRQIIDLEKQMQKVKAEIILTQAKMSGAAESFKDLLGALKKISSISIADEAELKKLFEEGGIEAVAKKLGVHLADLIDQAVMEGFEQVELPKLKIKFNSSIRDLKKQYMEAQLTGDEYVDSMIRFNTDFNNTIEELTEKIKADQEVLASGKAKAEDQVKLEEQIKVNEAERIQLVALKDARVELAKYTIDMNRNREALGQFRTAFIELFADVKEWTQPGASIGAALNQVAEARLRYVSENFVNSIIESLGATDLGAAITGNKPKDPLQGSMDSLKGSNFELKTSVDNLTITTLSLIEGYSSLGFGGFKIPEVQGTTGTTEEGKETTDKVYDMLKEFAKAGTNLISGFVGSTVANALNKEQNNVNAGVGIGGILGSAAIQGLKLEGFLADAIPFFGPLIGGMIGGLLGTDKEREVKDSDNLKRIAENTAQMVAIDRRIINAPADFTLPATSSSGGMVQWTGNIVVNGAGDPQATANAVAQTINKMISKGTSTFNTVNDRLY